MRTLTDELAASGKAPSADDGGAYRCARCGADVTWSAKKLHRGYWWCWSCPSEWKGSVNV